MQTSRFQLGLIATLAVGLGFSLASSPAIGYPAGSAVSMGSNPVASRGGTVTSGSTALFTASSDGPFLITDVVLSQAPCGSSTDTSTIVIEDEGGEELAVYRLASDSDGDGTSDDSGSTSAVIRHAYSTGVVIQADSSAFIRSTGCDGTVFSVAGYQAQG